VFLLVPAQPGSLGQRAQNGCCAVVFAVLLNCKDCEFHYFLWSPYGIGQTIIFLPCGSSFFLLLCFSSPNLSGRRFLCLPYFHTWCGLSANLGCRSETCCTRLAENTGCKNRHLRIIVQLCRATSLQVRHVLTIRKKLLRSNISSRRLHIMVNFGLLAAEISPVVWGTPANFNGFRVLAALLHASSSGRQPKFAALNGGRHLCSAGQPSRWALAHILVVA